MMIEYELLLYLVPYVGNPMQDDLHLHLAFTGDSYDLLGGEPARCYV